MTEKPRTFEEWAKEYRHSHNYGHGLIEKSAEDAWLARDEEVAALKAQTAAMLEKAINFGYPHEYVKGQDGKPTIERHCEDMKRHMRASLIPTDYAAALAEHDAVLTARTIKVCNEQTLKELQSGICCIPGANELLAERVQEAVRAHTIEARRLYLGTSPENYLNWLEKRIEAGRAALEAGDKAGDPK